jgi:arylsulfatase A-like enzyme
MRRLNRRDFLKLLSLAPAAASAASLTRTAGVPLASGARNVIVLVFDAWSARHMAMYGYPRQTMPNLEEFASRATVFHRHYSPGTFTVSGTASLLTGLEPWTHRALALSGEITAAHAHDHLFHLLSASHYTLGFSQNEFADLLLAQAGRDLDDRVPVSSFSLRQNLLYGLPAFGHDSLGAYASLEYNIFQRGTGADASLFLGPLRTLLQWRGNRTLDQEYVMTYPRGLPASPDLFRLEDIVDGAIALLQTMRQPSLAYLHLYPPHGDYRPKGKFNHLFDDGWSPPEKPAHHLVQDVKSFDRQNSQRQRYDQYLASWDAEIARLLGYLKTSGLLDSSYVIVTSDHGELFERGVVGHSTPIIYEPIVHVPLLLLQPGQSTRVDVRTVTSSIDLLPTLASLLVGQAPAWAEGQLLPGFGGTGDPGRSIYSMDAKTNSAFRRLERLSMSLLKRDYRLTYYRYPEQHYESFELYNVGEDPEELMDIYAAQPTVARPLQEELLGKLDEINRGFFK